MLAIQLSSCSAKSESDKEREHSLMAQWIALTEERAAVAIPAPNSKIPGSPCDWTPPLGTEKHVPVVFLDLNPDDMAGEASASEVYIIFSCFIWNIFSMIYYFIAKLDNSQILKIFNFGK